MKEMLLVMIVACIFLYGYFLVKRIDVFLGKSEKIPERKNEIRESSRIVLDDNFSDEEVINELHRFREGHKKWLVILCDESQFALVKKN